MRCIYNAQSYLDMKKILGILALSLAFVACEKDVKFSDPGMRATMTRDVLTDTAQIKGNPYSYFTEYKPTTFKAYVVNDKNLIIDAQTDSTRLRIYLPDYEFGARYDFNQTANIKADYFQYDDFGNEQLVYSTDALKGGKPNSRPGYVILDPAEKQVPGSISGTFSINLNSKLLPDDVIDIETGVKIVRYVDVKTFDKGVFYRIPLEKGQ